jgi:aminopeptidase N
MFILFKQANDEGKLLNVNLSQMMPTWTRQKGHPVIHIKVLNSTHISVKQHRFVFDSTSSIDSLNR